jgi:lipopolysaccharide/colanic/teichoic acid biosynthesis glycosyltransferase
MYARAGKRVLDFSLALIALIVLLPLLLVLTLIGTAAFSGKPFFLQRRPGRIDARTGKERIFTVIKLRTMIDKTDGEGRPLADAQRTTRYGAVLRATGMDELPQLLNILAGQMSFVGPRPLLTEYLPLYTSEQRRRHTVRPGLTGLAQISGGRALTLEQKTALDVCYVEHITLARDVAIVCKTVGVLLRRCK